MGRGKEGRARGGRWGSRRKGERTEKIGRKMGGHGVKGGGKGHPLHS